MVPSRSGSASASLTSRCCSSSGSPSKRRLSTVTWKWSPPPVRSSTRNSGRALEALRAAGAPVTAVDILPDPSIRQELAEVSGWPTIPQVFVKGELVGGADITEELGASGELALLLEEKLGAGYRDGAEEHVVDVLSGTRA